MLIYDGFETYKILEILEYYFEHKIILYRLLSHTSYKLQPYNVAIFILLKSAYREQIKRLKRDNINIIGKEHFTSLYSPIREIAFTPKNIKVDFAISKLILFNLDRVFRIILKPPAKLTISIVDKIIIEPRSQDKIL